MGSRLREAVEAFQRGDLEAALAMADAHADKAIPEWEHLIGLIECRRGNPKAGLIHLRAAARAQPDNPGFRLMLARALVDSGCADEVLEMDEAPTAPSPVNVALWQVCAEAAEKAQNASARTHAWRSIAAMTPIDQRAWLNLGRSLLQEENFTDAADAYRKALEIDPSNLEGLHELALVYERAGEITMMVGLLDSALSIGVAKERLPFAWALLEQRLGNVRESRRLLDIPGADRDRTRWLRLVATVEDKLGNSAATFAAATAMNCTMPDFDHWRQRGAAYRRELRYLAEAIAAWPTGLPTLPRASGPPTFLVGFPRSGTTLLDTFLMGHPEIEVLEELPLLLDAIQGLGPTKNLPSMSVSSLDMARKGYLRALAATGASGHVVDKFPLNMLAAPLIHSLFPGAPIIFLQRHPSDCVLSGFTQAFVANVGNASFLDIGDAADFYDACMRVWTASVAALPLNVHTVSYEKLVADPEAELRPLVAHLGLDWDERILEHRKTAAGRGPIPNTSYNQVSEPLTLAPVFRWRRYAKELEPVLPVLLPWAERLGYES